MTKWEVTIVTSVWKFDDYSTAVRKADRLLKENPYGLSLVTKDD